MAAGGAERLQRGADREFRTFEPTQGAEEWRDMSAVFDKEERVLEYEAIKLIN